MIYMWNVLKKMKIKLENFFIWVVLNFNIDVKFEFQLQFGMKLKLDVEVGYFKFLFRISIFLGDKKFDVFYDLWKYEVICLMKELKIEEFILQVVRRFVRGEVANVIMRLGVGVFIYDIFYKMDSIYGNVLE